MYIAVVNYNSKFCIVTATCRVCSGEHHFLAIGRIVYTTSCSHCEAGGSVWVSHLSPCLQPVMSTTSTATALVVHGPTLGSAHDLANYICILVATLGNGTPFSPNSIHEEDLMQLCMGLGQAHLDGVFQISETEALLAFHFTAEVTHATHLLFATMSWHVKLIRLHTCPVTNTHLRAYVAERGACPSSAQTLIPGREVVSQSSLATLTL